MGLHVGFGEIALNLEQKARLSLTKKSQPLHLEPPNSIPKILNIGGTENDPCPDAF